MSGETDQRANRGRVARGAAVAGGALVAACAIGLSGPPAPAAERVTCKSGQTVYQQGGSRIFRTSSGGTAIYRACRPRSPRPLVLLRTTAPDHLLRLAEQERGRVLYAIEEVAESGGGVEIGWFALRAPARRRAALNQTAFGQVRALSTGADGTLAVATTRTLDETGDFQRIAVLRRARAAAQLTRPTVVATVPGGIRPDSLAVVGGTVRWTTTGGEQGSAPVR